VASRVLTSWWFATLPADHVKIGISRGTPRGQPGGYRRYPRLAPGPWFHSVDPVEYLRLYHDEVLSKLDPQRVVQDLREIAGDKTPVLVCFEKPEPSDDQWCHRGAVSAWLHDTVRLEVFEFGQEACGCGWQHPKLHSLQRPSADGR
jgi:hypothetical protein